MSFATILSQIKAKSEEFSSYLTECNELNEQLRHKSQKLLKLIDTKNRTPNKLCSICYVQPIQIALLPCGHVLCVGCSERAINRSRCFQCRGALDGSLKIYF